MTALSSQGGIISYILYNILTHFQTNSKRELRKSSHWNIVLIYIKILTNNQ